MASNHKATAVTIAVTIATITEPITIQKKKFLILFLDYGNTATIAKKCCIPLPSHYH